MDFNYSIMSFSKKNKKKLDTEVTLYLISLSLSVLL